MTHSSQSKLARKSRKRKQKQRERRKNQCRCQTRIPVMSGERIRYEISERVGAVSCGGLGLIRRMLDIVGFEEVINSQLSILKRQLPYHDSDHILNMAFNALTGGVTLEDIDSKRSDESYLKALGAESLPHSSTAGDYTRRFGGDETCRLMECFNDVRQRVWKRTGFRMKEALIDVDGTLASTKGECKAGMGLSYNGIWGYHPLLVSLANTQEVLFLVNRSANETSHAGAAEWLDKAIELVSPYADRVCLRGDTAFSLTANFDRWSEKADFVFGIMAHSKLVDLAQTLDESAWTPLARSKKYDVKTQPRTKPKNVKAQIVREQEYTNLRLKSEEIAEFDYRPNKCKKDYRVIVLRKNISKEKGENVLLDDIRYFFYITNRRDLEAEEIVFHANKRCNQENVIEQLKNGVNAMRMPMNNLHSNWAYMLITSLAWNCKSWLAHFTQEPARRQRLMKVEFRRFLNRIMLVPCQIIKQARAITYRIIGDSPWLDDFVSIWDDLQTA